MQEHDNQILVPQSFTLLYVDTRGRLRISPAELRLRYELCEDLASMLVDQAQTLYHVQAPSEAEILQRMHAGLAGGGAGLAPGEAVWVVTRLAELLGWPCPALAERGTPRADGA